MLAGVLEEVHSQVVDLAAVCTLTVGREVSVPSNQPLVAVWAIFAVSAKKLRRMEESFTCSKCNKQVIVGRQQLITHICRSWILQCFASFALLTNLHMHRARITIVSFTASAATAESCRSVHGLRASNVGKLTAIAAVARRA